VAFSVNNAKRVGEEFLNSLRQWVSRNNLNRTRLPPWLTAASIRVGWVKDSLVFVFEDALNHDSFNVIGAVDSDLVVLLNIDNFFPKAASLSARPDNTGLIIIQGTYKENERTVINLVGEKPALFNCGYAGYHGPLGLINIFLQHLPGGPRTSPVAVRYIPFALYVNAHDSIDPKQLWSCCEEQLGNTFLDIHNSDTGTYYERLQGRATTFALNKRSGVIVLGKDTGNELLELIQVRDYLRGLGYDAELIKDLPEIQMMSNEEKVRLWTLVSRFVVMVDRLPAGHLVEYLAIREQRTIMALLRQQGHGSTYMIGDDAKVDLNFIKVFEFDVTPLSVLNSSREWAEKIVQERTTAYNKAYPWRDKQFS
jgi:hypothetical protein